MNVIAPYDDDHEIEWLSTPLDMAEKHIEHITIENYEYL